MKVATYMRYSSDAQKEASIEQQLREIESFCKNNNYEIVKIYSDYALSGKFDFRPQFEQMLKDSTLGIFQGIVVFDLSRFSRGGEQGIADELILKKNNVAVISATENFSNDLGGKIVKSIKYLMNEEYLNQLSLNVQRGQKDNALKGLWNGGTPPLGYDVKNQKLIINENEKYAVELIFNNFASGMSISKICDLLNSNGYRTKKYNKLFNTTSLYDILRNEKYIGKLIFKKTKRISLPDGKERIIKQPEFNHIILENAVPKIINDNIWLICQNRLKANVRKRNTLKTNYTLTGKIKCGECGANYVGDGRKVKHTIKGDVVYYYYACQNKKNKNHKCFNRSINKEILESLIHKLILSECYNNSKINENIKILKNFVKNLKFDKEKKINEIQTKILREKNQRERIINLTINGVLSTNDCINRTKDCDAKIKTLEQNILMLKRIKNINLNEIDNCYLKFKKMISENLLNFDEIVKLHLNSIEIKKSTIIVNLNIFPIDILSRLQGGDYFGADERT